MFQSLIKGLDETTQTTLRILYAKNRILEEEYARREKEQLKQEVAEYVISHLQATVDISEVLMQIEELRKAIDSLGKWGIYNGKSTYLISASADGKSPPRES